MSSILKKKSKPKKQDPDKKKSSNNVKFKKKKSKHTSSNDIKNIINDNNQQTPPDKKQPKSKEKSSNNLVTNEIIEKEMLKGQLHKPDEETMFNPNLSRESNDLTNRSNKSKNDNLRELRPRELYLKQKIITMNFSEKLINGIGKTLDTQVKNIQNELKNNQLLLTAVNKNFKFHRNKTVNSNELGISLDKTKIKKLKELKSEQNYVKQNLNKIIENEKVIKAENFNSFNMNSLLRNQVPHSLSLDKKLKLEEYKKLDIQKKNLISKINDIEYQINQLLLEENLNFASRKNKIKNFLDNFEKDKEIIETRAKKYYKESQAIKNNMSKEIQTTQAKIQKEMALKQEQDEKNKKNLLIQFKLKEKAIEDKRAKECIKKVLMYKGYATQKLDKNIKKYLFFQKSEKYQKIQENLILSENKRRKLLMKSLSRDELNTFQHNYKENKEKYNSENSIKKKQLLKEWKERKNSLPSHSNNYLKEEYEKDKEEEKKIEKTERINNLIQLKINYSNLIKDEKKPKLDKKLKQKRLEIISRLENPKNFIKEDMLKRKKHKRILLKKRDPSKFLWRLKLEDPQLEKLNNSEIIRRPKRIFVSSLNKAPHKPLDKKIDYLKEFRNKKIKRVMSYKKWDRILNDDKGSFNENVNLIRNKVDSMEEEAIMKEKVLKLNGGVENNPELGQKVTDLIIGSIEAKLSILNKLKNQ